MKRYVDSECNSYDVSTSQWWATRNCKTNSLTYRDMSSTDFRIPQYDGRPGQAFLTFQQDLRIFLTSKVLASRGTDAEKIASIKAYLLVVAEVGSNVESFILRKRSEIYTENYGTDQARPYTDPYALITNFFRIMAREYRKPTPDDITNFNKLKFDADKKEEPAQTYLRWRRLYELCQEHITISNPKAKFLATLSSDVSDAVLLKLDIAAPDVTIQQVVDMAQTIYKRQELLKTARDQASGAGWNKMDTEEDRSKIVQHLLENATDKELLTINEMILQHAAGKPEVNVDSGCDDPTTPHNSQARHDLRKMLTQQQAELQRLKTLLADQQHNDAYGNTHHSPATCTACPFKHPVKEGVACWYTNWWDAAKDW